MTTGYGIAFDGAVSWNFCNNLDKSVITFGFDNNSSSRIDNRKNDFLALGEGPTSGINRIFGPPGKGLVFILVKQIQNFASVYITFIIIVTSLLMEKKSLSLMLIIKILVFQLSFV